MESREEKMVQAFGNIFVLAQRWQTLGDNFLGQWGLTTKQWLLLATIEMSLGGAARLGEVSGAYGTSYQNVKRIAGDLAEKGFLKIEQDPEDKRALVLTITDKNVDFWGRHNEEALEYVRQLFKTLSDTEVKNFASNIQKLNMQTETLMD